MRIGLVQMTVTDGDVDANVTRAEAMIREVAAHTEGTPDVVLLPELWTTGYAHGTWGEVADRRSPQVAQRLAALATELNLTIGGSMVTRRSDGGLANRFTLTGPDGVVVASYDKSHLFAPMREDEFLAPGTSRVHATLGGGKGEVQTALSICYDLRFPGMYRASAHQGTQVYLVVSAWPEPRCAALRLLASARAVENQAILALCNRVGLAADGTTFCGGSMVITPAGDVVLDIGSSEGVGVVDVNVRLVTMARSMLGVLAGEVAAVDS